MVSDFINEFCRCLRFTDNEYTLFRHTNPHIKQAARLVLRYWEDRDGYWNSSKFIYSV